MGISSQEVTRSGGGLLWEQGFRLSGLAAGDLGLLGFQRIRVIRGEAASKSMRVRRLHEPPAANGEQEVSESG